MQPQRIEHVIQKLQTLAPQRISEVEDFIDFLQQRDNDKQLRQDYTNASQAAFSQLWDNEDDALYDSL